MPTIKIPHTLTIKFLDLDKNDPDFCKKLLDLDHCLHGVLTGDQAHPLSSPEARWFRERMTVVDHDEAVLLQYGLMYLETVLVHLFAEGLDLETQHGLFRCKEESADWYLKGSVCFYRMFYAEQTSEKNYECYGTEYFSNIRSLDVLAAMKQRYHGNKAKSTNTGLDINLPGNR